MLAVKLLFDQAFLQLSLPAGFLIQITNDEILNTGNPAKYLSFCSKRRPTGLVPHKYNTNLIRYIFVINYIAVPNQPGIQLDTFFIRLLYLNCRWSG